ASPGTEAIHEFHVMALSRENGSTLWNQTARVERPHEGSRAEGTFASGSVVTEGENVIAFFGSRGLYCYDMNGNLRWEKDFGDMDIRNDFGEGATPALYGDTVVVTWDHQGPSFIVALNKNTGEETWRRDRDEVDTWATPLVVEHNGVAQVITAGTNRVRSYNLENGEILWEGDGLTANPIPSPVFADGVVYLMSGYRGNALRAIRLADAKGDVTGTSAVLWEHNRDTPYVPSPLLYENNLYFLKSNSAILTTIDARTGQPLYGPLRLEGLSEVYASPVGAAGRVYLLGRDGNTLVIENSPEFKILARNALDDGFDASPAIVGGEMYLRGYRNLYKIAAN
ncbi:MAG TPA: PQQ-binding-like beta-propeller repeat protein, partial [Vicinamibacteria bacterium]